MTILVLEYVVVGKLDIPQMTMSYRLDHQPVALLGGGRIFRRCGLVEDTEVIWSTLKRLL